MLHCNLIYSQKLSEKENTYKQHQVTIKYQEKPFVILILTPIMKRCHSLLPSCKSVVFVDTTSACDAENHSLTFLLAPCAIGAVPIGVIITQDQTQNSYTAGFSFLAQEMREGFGKQGYPDVFITDNSEAEINALKSVWPKSSHFLCIFHVAQAVWRWLCDSNHLVSKEDRSGLMNRFRKVLYSHSVTEAGTEFEGVFDERYPLWNNYMRSYWSFKEKWCLAWRNHRVRGNHTNNYAEVSIRIFKDNILSRMKAYNCIALVDFCCSAYLQTPDG